MFCFGRNNSEAALRETIVCLLFVFCSLPFYSLCLIPLFVFLRRGVSCFLFTLFLVNNSVCLFTACNIPHIPLMVYCVLLLYERGKTRGFCLMPTAFFFENFLKCEINRGFARFISFRFPITGRAFGSRPTGNVF